MARSFTNLHPQVCSLENVMAAARLAEKDGALERRFQALRIEEPTAEETVAILRALRERMENHHGVVLDDGALRAAVW